jgi:hypothetical protein
LTELEQVAAACIVALLIVLAAAAVRCGWVEGSATVKLIPPWKRQRPEPKPVSAPEAEPLREIP